MVWAGYEFIIYSFPGLLVALRYCLHGGFPSVFKNDGEDCGDSRLPQQPDQPLPLHDHQQRREVSVEEDFPLSRPHASQAEKRGHGGIVKLKLPVSQSEENPENVHSVSGGNTITNLIVNHFPIQNSFLYIEYLIHCNIWNCLWHIYMITITLFSELFHVRFEI